tara:strand:+ start:88 stop:498 length:411 start_codon:yes stop_codon:yes gene_type:complete
MDINNLTPDQVAKIKANGGFSGTLKGGLDIESATAGAPVQSIPITGYGTDVRGTWGRKDCQELVTKVDVSKNIAAHTARIQQEASEQALLLKEREELRDVTDPRKLMAQMQYLDRQLKKLTKEVNALRKASGASSI